MQNEFIKESSINLFYRSITSRWRCWWQCTVVIPISRLSGLDEKRFIRFQFPQAFRYRVEAFPVPRGLPGAAVDYQIFWRLGILQVVVKHPVYGFDSPVLAAELFPPRGLDVPGHCNTSREIRTMGINIVPPEIFDFRCYICAIEIGAKVEGLGLPDRMPGKL